MTFTEAKAQQTRLWDANTLAGRELNAFLDTQPKGLMGLTPDNVRTMPEYIRLNNAYRLTFAVLQKYNAAYVKLYRKEILADRAKRYSPAQ